MISILDKSVAEVIPPAFLITSEMVVRFSVDLLTIRFSDDWLFYSEFLPISNWLLLLFPFDKSSIELLRLSLFINETES